MPRVLHLRLSFFEVVISCLGLLHSTWTSLGVSLKSDIFVLNVLLGESDLQNTKGHSLEPHVKQKLLNHPELKFLYRSRMM